MNEQNPHPAARSSTRSARAVVEEFLHALESLDMDGARALMATDIFYQNVPFPADRGIEATTKTLKKFLLPFDGFEVEILNIAEDGHTVLTERIDTFTNGRFRAGFWVCGTFEVHDGRITLWRDRFDLMDLTFQMLRGLVRLPFVRA